MIGKALSYLQTPSKTTWPASLAYRQYWWPLPLHFDFLCGVSLDSLPTCLKDILVQGYFGPRMMMFCDGRWGQMLRAQGGKVCSFSHSNSVMSVSAARNGRHSPLLRLVVGLWLDLEKRELRFVHFVFSNYVCSPTLLLLRNLITKPVSSPSNSNQMGREALEGFRVSQKPAASRKIYKHPVIHNLKSMVC